MKLKVKILASFFYLTFFANKVFACVPGVNCPNDKADTDSTTKIFFKIPNFSPFNNLSGFINVLISLAFFAAGLFFFFNLIIGGIQWINAGGDAKALDSARTRLTNAVIGLIIVVAAFAITGIVGSVFGISIIRGFRFR
jgi:hypothetical protein